MSNDQADTLIIQHARILKSSSPNRPIYVVSSDYDFLALPGVVSVDALIDVVRGIIIYKTDVLELLHIGAVDLAHCYCISGCDDVETNLRGIGIKGAVAYMRTNVLSIESLVRWFDKFERTELEKLLKEIKKLRLKLDVTLPTYSESLDVSNEKSMISNFLGEVDDTEELKRPGLFALYTAKVKIHSFVFNPLEIAASGPREPRGLSQTIFRCRFNKDRA